MKVSIEVLKCFSISIYIGIKIAPGNRYYIEKNRGKGDRDYIDIIVSKGYRYRKFCGALRARCILYRGFRKSPIFYIKGNRSKYRNFGRKSIYIGFREIDISYRYYLGTSKLALFEIEIARDMYA